MVSLVAVALATVSLAASVASDGTSRAAAHGDDGSWQSADAHSSGLTWYLPKEPHRSSSADVVVVIAGGLAAALEPPWMTVPAKRRERTAESMAVDEVEAAMLN
jgi:hypothetical protein